MAKNTNSKTGSSKIRFIMLEADLSEGDLSQVTQAIQNALRPAASSPTRFISNIPTRNRSEDESDIVLNDVQDDLEDEVFETPKPRPVKSSKPRVAKTPTVLDDIDVSSDPSLKDFVSQFDLVSNVDKYLVVALWFRDGRQIANITADHVYTCFKVLGWSTNTNDFAKPLRNLRDDQSLKGGSREGFSLTLPGAGKIEAKKRSQ